MTGPFPLGAFVLHETIGRGGMGEVWRGEHVREGVPIAAKLLLSNRGWGTLGRELFSQEVRAVASLDHPGVVMVLDHGAVTAEEEARSGGRLTRGTPWLVMELCTGGTLFELRGRMPWAALRPALLRLLDALAHSHARGVVHRDIKLGNVLIGADCDLRPGLKFTDFGIALVRDPSQVDVLDEDTFAGSPSYSAPEQLEGRTRDIGPWTDLFSLGCLTWTLCCGAPPGAGLPLAGLVRSRLEGRLPPFEPVVELPPELEPWLRGMLARDPERRFACAADAAWALRSQTPEPDVAETLAVDLPSLGATDRLTITTPRRTPTRSPTEVLSLDGSDTGDSVRRFARLARESLPDLTPLPSPRGQGPPMVDDWRREEAQKPPTKLLGAGLGLYALRTVPLVAREAERDRIWEALREVVRTGNTQCLLVQGAAGVGKTRLVEWIAERAEELGLVRVVRALHGRPPGPVDGLGPALERALRLERLDGEPLEARIADRLSAAGIDDVWLASAVAELVRPGATSRRDGRRVTLRSASVRIEVVVDALRALSQERPVLLWLDDIQWGAEAAELVARLARTMHHDRLPILLIATVRTPVEPRASGAEALQGLAQLQIPTMDIEPLTRAEERALVHDLLRLHDDLVDEVVERSAGNPLFAVQLLGDWIRRGELETTEAGWRRTTSGDARLPDDLHSLWTSRFDDLLADAEDTVWRALELGAALGQEVDADTWLDVCHFGGLRAQGLVERLVGAGLARRTTRGWTFIHGMARESVARRSLDEGRWPVLHALAARHLQGAHEPEDVIRRGRHRLQARQFGAASGDLRSGIQTCLRRGRIADAAELLDAFEEAVSSSALPPTDLRVLEARLLRLRVDRARSGALAPDALWTLLEATRTAGHPHLECDTQRELGVALRTVGRVDDAVAELESAADLADALSYPQGRARALVSLGYALEAEGQRDEAVTALKQAVSVLGTLNDHQGLAQAYRALAEIAGRRGHLDRALDWAQSSLDIARSLGDIAAEADACVILAATFVKRDEPEEAQKCLAEARVARRRAGNRTGLAEALNLEGELHRKQGRYAEAEAAYRETLALHETMGTGWTFIARMNLGLVLMEGGHFERALVPLRAAHGEVAAMGRQPLMISVDALLLAPLAASGLLDELEETVERLEVTLPGHTRRDPEVLQALRWAAPMLERAERESVATRIDILAGKYCAHLDLVK